MEQVGQEQGAPPPPGLQLCPWCLSTGPRAPQGLHPWVRLYWAAHSRPCSLCLFFSPTCSRVGFYVNTFQSIAGLEENFHKEMSKVGLVTPRASASGQGQAPASLLGWDRAPVATTPPLGPREELPTQSVQAQWELLGAWGWR